VLGGLIAVAVAAGVAVAWRPLNRQADSLVTLVGAAEPLMLSLAVLAASAAVLATGAAWLALIRELGSRVDVDEGLARYVVACLAPPKLGNPTRIALLAKTVPGQRPLWAMTGVCGGVSLARQLPLAVLVIVAAALNVLPLWLGLAVAAAVVLGLGAALVLSRRGDNTRLRRLLEGFSLVVRTPRAATFTFAFLLLATLGKVCVAAATAEALRVDEPLRAALVLVPSMAYGRMLPFLGTAVATVAVDLTSRGNTGMALSLAVAFTIAEAIGGILCGLAGAAKFVHLSHLKDWRGSLTNLRALDSTSSS